MSGPTTAPTVSTFAPGPAVVRIERLTRWPISVAATLLTMSAAELLVVEPGPLVAMARYVAAWAAVTDQSTRFADVAPAISTPSRCQR